MIQAASSARRARRLANSSAEEAASNYEFSDASHNSSILLFVFLDEIVDFNESIRASIMDTHLITSMQCNANDSMSANDKGTDL